MNKLQNILTPPIHTVAIPLTSTSATQMGRTVGRSMEFCADGGGVGGTNDAEPVCFWKKIMKIMIMK